MVRFCTLLFISLQILLTSCSERDKSESVSSNRDTLVCTEMYDEDFDIKDVMDFPYYRRVEERFRNDSVIAKYLFDKPSGREIAASGLTHYLWPLNYKFKIQFIDGDERVISKVIPIAKKWEEWANVKMTFGKFNKPDATVSFSKDKGSWSYIGVESAKKRPSMNFGWLTDTTSDEEYNRVVLHEFGHLLGLIHEHQTSDSNPIKWNRNEVIKYYKKKNDWDETEVEKYILSRYSHNRLRGSRFDKESIMLYYIPKELTYNISYTEKNTQLSETDKEVIKTLYP